MPTLPRRHGSLAALATITLLVAPTAASAKDTVTTLPGFKAPGTPSSLNKVKVLKQGSAKARNVLVLEPGTSAGAANFQPVAAALLKRLKGWQVWSIERRENGLEDQSALDRVKRGQDTPQQLFDYYLGWIGNANATGEHFEPKSTEQTSFARGWGMNVAMQDLRRVIRSAGKGKRKVVLGGHSLGGSMAVAYATWDFKGRAGAKDLDGLVLIDGGSSSRKAPTVKAAKASLAELAEGSPFIDLTGLGLPWSAGVFNAIGSTLALKAPDERSILADWPLLPAELKAPFPVTNRAAYGYAIDTQTGPKNLALVQQHVGRLASSGDPRDWVDGELGGIRFAAAAFSGPVGMDGSSWYHPRRLSLDSSVVNGGVRTAAQKTLGVRTTRGRDVKVPIYAFETSLGKGRVLKGAQALARRSKVRRRDVTLVDRSRTYAHIDPLSADPRKNAFLKTVAPFLQRIGR
ncbi:MAG: alpha/beta fold hydrolase [Solirubrobacterales bacterium]|nr:alpha/beta fold hydrolase [Solirubrobacterales bacterium]